MKRTALFLLVFILCLSMAEWVVRSVVRSPANEQYAANRDAYAWSPYASVLRTDEGYARFDMDVMGFNNDPLPSPLPASRLMVFGDSFVQSVQVMRPDNFISLLNLQLRDQYAFAYNAGLAGSDPSYFPFLFEELNARVKARHVLLCLSENDISDLKRWPLKKGADGHYTEFVRGNETPDAFGRLRAWVYAHSALVTHLKFRYDLPVRQWVNEKAEWLESLVYAAPLPASVDVSADARAKWRFVLEYFLDRGITVTVLVMPVLESRVGGSAELDYQGIDALAAEAERMGVPVLDSNPAMVADFRATGIPAKGFANSIPGTGHMNQHGHRVLADVLISNKAILFR